MNLKNNTYVCIYILVCVCVCVCIQSYLTLYDPVNCSLPGSTVHWIFQARILEWVAISYSNIYSYIYIYIYIYTHTHIYIYTQLNYCTVHLKLTELHKSTIIQ